MGASGAPSAPPLEPLPPSAPPLLPLELLLLVLVEEPVVPLEELLDALSPHAASIERTKAHGGSPVPNTQRTAESFIDMKVSYGTSADDIDQI